MPNWGSTDALGSTTAERLPRIAAPTLVVVGDEDVLTPVRFARAMAAFIPGASLEIVPAHGHAFSFENPELFASIVREFVSGGTDSPPR